MNFSTNMMDYLHLNDRTKLEEFLPYLQCSKCSELMQDPKMCQICNKNFCFNCRCLHKQIQSRHIKLILEKFPFKCKYDCGINDLKYWDIKAHVLECNSQQHHTANITVSASKIQIETSFPTFNFDREYANYLPCNDDATARSASCPKCGLGFHKKEEFMNHCTTCQGIAPAEQEITKEDDEKRTGEIIEEFNTNHQGIRQHFQKLLTEKMSFLKALAQNKLISCYQMIKDKTDLIQKTEEDITKYSSEQAIEGIYTDDQIIKALIHQETLLQHEKKSQFEKLISINTDVHSLIERNNESLRSELYAYVNEILSIENEESWSNELLEMSYSESETNCTLCGSVIDNNEKKYYCNMCRGNFCIGKCVTKCIADKCSKYLCPKDSLPCKLCHKKDYCSSCQKKCFYARCSNTFCPECYQRNEYQTRNSSSISCRIYTCDSDHACDCLMTSLFCPECQKRLCNKCLQKDKNHHTILKLFSNNII